MSGPVAGFYKAPAPGSLPPSETVCSCYTQHPKEKRKWASGWATMMTFEDGVKPCGGAETQLCERVGLSTALCRRRCPRRAAVHLRAPWDQSAHPLLGWGQCGCKCLRQAACVRMETSPGRRCPKHPREIWDHPAEQHWPSQREAGRGCCNLPELAGGCRQ